MSNPWEALATGVLLPEQPKSSPGHLKRQRRYSTKRAMEHHGVDSITELRTRQVLRDNTQHKGINQPVGKGYIWRNLGHKGSDE